MENTNEQKAKFFALYWGQEIQKYSNDIGTYCINVMFTKSIDKSYLELKPLSSISDEDAMKVAEIEMGFKSKKVYKNQHNITVTFEGKVGRHYMNIHNNGYIEFVSPEDGFDDKHGVTTNAYDYLRKKGYALPYDGITVEQQIQRGWIKLT